MALLPGPGTVLVADIAKGADGLNRDYSRPGAPAWGWRVAKALTWADITIVDMNGTPAMVQRFLDEGNLSGHIGEFGTGRIGFWGFFPIGELPFPYDPAEGLEWKHSWIGTFHDAHYPWVYVEPFGWIWVDGFDPQNVWAWSVDRQDWFWMRDTAFPWLYDSGHDAWRFYAEGSEGHWFYNATTNT